MSSMIASIFWLCQLISRYLSVIETHSMFRLSRRTDCPRKGGNMQADIERHGGKQAVSKAETIQDRSGRRSRSSPRLPSRERGIQRYELLVDSVEILLREKNPDEFGLYQIAEQAGIPSASVYHFFPTKEAAFLALAHRYLAGFAAIKQEDMASFSLSSWQDLMAHDINGAVAYYNANPPAMKLFLGRIGGLDARRAEAEHNERMATLNYARFESFFHMPSMKDQTRMFHISTEIVDSVLAISFIKYGLITVEYREQALAAAMAYCRLFLPESTEPRT
jgi:AcrR family transcriptional regulator